VVDLCECHACDDCQHDLLALGRVRVLDVLEQPRLERARRLTCRVLPSYIKSGHCTEPKHHQQSITVIHYHPAPKAWDQVTAEP